MDEQNTPPESGEQTEQTEQPAAHEPIDEWNNAPTERHLSEERSAAAERPTGQPYPSQQPYPPYPPYPSDQLYAPNRYGRGADPSLPLRQAGGREQNAWRSGQQAERRRGPAWVPVVGGCLVAIAAVMVLCAIASGIVFGLARNGGMASDTLTRDVTVNGPVTITVRARAANVQVEPGTTGQVTAVLNKEVRALNHDRAQRALDEITLDVTQSGNTLTITVEGPSFRSFEFFSHSVDLTITTPAATSLDAQLDAGNLNVRGLTGTLSTDVAAGNLTVDDMRITDQATLQVRAGNVRASRIRGAVSAAVHFGNVRLTEATLTQNSTIHSDAGNVVFEGSLRSGTSLDVTSNAGNISVTLPQQTDAHLNATTNAGKVSVAGWPGISQTSSGATASVTGDLSAHPTGTVMLHVNAGNIAVAAE